MKSVCKKCICVMCALILVLALGSCGEEPQASASKVDVDLTQLSNTMVYSEVFNMLNTPHDYVGKTVKMKGIMTTYQNTKKTRTYRTCLITDATSCCSQGIEFVLTGGSLYPAEGSEITVMGTFNLYLENEQMYCHLVNATLV